MNLLIISHTPHYKNGNQIVGWGPTVREIDQLAKLFQQVTHLAVLYDEDAPLSSLSYTADNVSFVPVRPAGGITLRAKLGVLLAYANYWKAIRKAINSLNEEDIIHVRCPSNISLLAVLYLTFKFSRPRRWIKYAGNWKPDRKEAWSYTLQRFMLQKNFHRGMVTINGNWNDQPKHAYSFYNPSIALEDLELSSRAKTFESVYHLLFVGRIETPKGAGRIIEIAAILRDRKIAFHLDIVGDGFERAGFEELTQTLNLTNQISFHGWLPKTALEKFYNKAHFFILPTASEGWPKVLSEAMAYGVVPIAGAVSSIPQILQESKSGLALDPLDTEAFANAICIYIDNPQRWAMESRCAREAAGQFTYEAYLEKLSAVFAEQWKIKL